MLANEPDIDIVGLAGDGAEAVTLRPDIADRENAWPACLQQMRYSPRVGASPA
jgi:hypothetical protein